MFTSRYHRLAGIIVAMSLLLTACGDSSSSDAAAVPEATVAAPTVAATQVPTTVPTATAEPSPTPVPPEPTATEVPPTVTPEPSPTVDSAAPAGEDVDSALLVGVGASVYATNCAGCHGADGGGTDRGPAVIGIGQFFVEDASPLTNLVTNGGTNMPAFGTKLTAEEIDGVVEYVVGTFP